MYFRRDNIQSKRALWRYIERKIRNLENEEDSSKIWLNFVKDHLVDDDSRNFFEIIARKAHDSFKNTKEEERTLKQKLFALVYEEYFKDKFHSGQKD